MTNTRSAILVFAGIMLMGTAYLFEQTGLLRFKDLLPRPPQDILQTEAITPQTIHYILPDDQVPRYVNLIAEDKLVEEIQLPIDEDLGRRLTIEPPTEGPTNWGRVKYYGLLHSRVSILEDAPPVICQGRIVSCQTSGRRMVDWTLCTETIQNNYAESTSVDLELMRSKSLAACDSPIN